MELQPCPFCGKENTAQVTRASELWDEDDEGYPYPHSESFAVMCDASKPGGPGGCGGASGYCETEAEAIAAWNRRASRSPVVGAPELPYALMEACRIPAVDEYFNARQQIDSRDRRKVYEAGYAKGWDDYKTQRAAFPTAAGPMTEEQIVRVSKEIFGPDERTAEGAWAEKSLDMVWVRAIATPLVRAVERHFGIGVSPTGSPEGEVK